MIDKRKGLDCIREEIINCNKCWMRAKNEELRNKPDGSIDQQYGLPVPGVGSQTAKLMIIGEAPGGDEVVEGKPFVGKAGALLRRAVLEAGITNELAHLIYISNVIHCRPEKNKFPESPEDIEQVVDVCRTYVLRELAIIKPAIVIACGNKPLKYMFKQDFKISDVMGKRIKVPFKSLDFETILVPVMHPSFCLRGPMKFDVSPDQLSRGQLMMSLTTTQKQDLFFKHIAMAVEEILEDET